MKGESREKAGDAETKLTINRVSDNVGGVKLIPSELLRALEQERHFALVEEVPFQPRLAS